MNTEQFEQFWTGTQLGKLLNTKLETPLGKHLDKLKIIFRDIINTYLSANNIILIDISVEAFSYNDFTTNHMTCEILYKIHNHDSPVKDIQINYELPRFESQNEIPYSINF